MLPVDDILGLVLLVIPEDADGVSPVHNELVAAAIGGVGHKPPKVLLLLEGLYLGGNKLLADATFPPIPVNVGELVDTQGVLLVEGHIVELPDSGRGLSGGRVLDESEPGK